MRIESSFIQVPGIGDVRERRLWSAGVTSWREELDPEPVGPKTTERLLDFRDEATSRLADDDAKFFASALPSAERWRLLESFRDRLTALDIETTGLDAERDVVTTVSLHGPDGTRTFVRDHDLDARTLARELADVDILVTFNGSQFDLPFLERAFDVSVEEIPHVDLRFPCRRAGLGGGLKRAERAVGIERDLPAVDGREAIRLWHQYRNGDGEALERLIAYNREDTRSLLPLADHLVDALDREVFDPYLENGREGAR